MGGNNNEKTFKDRWCEKISTEWVRIKLWNADNPTYGGVKEFIAREGTSYSSYGSVSDDYQYIFEAYEFKNNRDEKWCAIVVAPVDKILAGSISTGDLAVNIFINEDQIYRTVDIETWANGVTAVDGTTPKFNNRYVNIENQ